MASQRPIFARRSVYGNGRGIRAVANSRNHADVAPDTHRIRDITTSDNPGLVWDPWGHRSSRRDMKRSDFERRWDHKHTGYEESDPTRCWRARHFWQMWWLT